MAHDPRLDAIHRSVADLLACEGDVAGRLERARVLAAGNPDALAVFDRFRPLVQAHRDQLASYLSNSGGAGPGGETARHRPAPTEPAILSEFLRELSLAFHDCALTCGMAYEVALRLLEPRLREILPEHLKVHVAAAQDVSKLLPGIVASELARGGLHCLCTCPMCGLGACACISWGTEFLVDALRGTAPAETAPSGFVLLPPTRDSTLARAGVQGGDVIIEVDGQSVPGRTEIQAALRKHAPGDEVRLVILSGSGTPRELVVRYAGDYVKA
jgi:PDZ domain